MVGLNALARHVGDWVSIRAHAERSPTRLTITIEIGDLPEPWTGTQRRARTWSALLGLVCIAPFAILLAVNALKGLGFAEPYTWFASSSVATLAGTISLFVGIPAAIAVNLWRVARAGMRRVGGSVEGMVGLELAPLHLLVLVAAALLGALFLGHIAADSYACLNGVRSAC